MEAEGQVGSDPEGRATAMLSSTVGGGVTTREMRNLGAI